MLWYRDILKYVQMRDILKYVQMRLSDQISSHVLTITCNK